MFFKAIVSCKSTGLGFKESLETCFFSYGYFVEYNAHGSYGNLANFGQLIRSTVYLFFGTQVNFDYERSVMNGFIETEVLSSPSATLCA